MIRDARITVIGAGPGGLSVALALARGGARVRIIEQSDALTEVGAGVQLSSNGGYVLQALGIYEALRNLSVQAEGIELYDALSAKRVGFVHLNNYGAGPSHLMAHRQDVISVLEAACRQAGVELNLGQKVSDISHDHEAHD